MENNVRVKTYQTSTSLDMVETAINNDFKRGNISGKILSVDAFTTGINNDTLDVIISYRENEEAGKSNYKAIVEYFCDNDSWFEDTNYCVPPKVLSTGPHKDAIVIIGIISIS